MKKGNLRTKRIYPEKGIIKFCVEFRRGGLWKLIGDKSGAWIFDTEEEAVTKIMELFDSKNAVIEKINNHGIEAENLKAGV